MKCLNFGCGWNYKRSSEHFKWENLDVSKEVVPDIVSNGTKIPRPDNYYDYVQSVHSFEHCKEPLKVLKELWRVTRNGGMIKIVVPFGWSWQDNLFHETMGYHWGSFNKFKSVSGRKYYHGISLEPIQIYAEAASWKKLIPFKKILSYFLNNIYYQITYELVVIK